MKRFIRLAVGAGAVLGLSTMPSTSRPTIRRATRSSPTTGRGTAALCGHLRPVGSPRRR